jgi:hypothetical protein
MDGWMSSIEIPVQLAAGHVACEHNRVDLIDNASSHGGVAIVIDNPASNAQLLLAVAAEHQVPVAYVTGLQMRRAADLYTGSAKTDPRDA